MKVRRVFLSLALAFGLCVLLLETVPRLTDVPGFTLRELDPITYELDRANIEPHPYLAYSNRPNYSSPEKANRQISHNSLGLRGPEVALPKPEGTFRIVCLGGSSTYGHGPSTNEKTWPARLQHHLAVGSPQRTIDVINAGCRGYSTFESLVNYAFRMSDLDPDMVLVYHTVNDMRCALYLDVQRDNTHFRAKWLQPPATTFSASYTYLFWRRYLTDYYEGYGDQGNFLIVDFDKNLKQLPPGAPPREPPFQIKQDTELGYRNFHRNLESIVALADKDGAAVVIATQAFLPRADPQTNDEVKAFGTMTGILRKVATDHDTIFVDVQSGVRDLEVARTPGEPSLFIDSTDFVEVHLTDHGADEVARIFAEGLISRGF